MFTILSMHIKLFIEICLNFGTGYRPPALLEEGPQLTGWLCKNDLVLNSVLTELSSSSVLGSHFPNRILTYFDNQ